MQSATLRLIQEEEKSHKHQQHQVQHEQPYSEALRETDPAVQSDSFRRITRALGEEGKR